MRKAKWISSIFFSLFILFIVFTYLSERDACRPYRYLIPNGYVGWIKVTYNVNGAAPLQIGAKGFYVLKIPQSGILKTSSPMQTCFTEIKFDYIDNNGNIKELNCWGDTDNNNMVWDDKRYGPYGLTEKYFIGTKKEFQNTFE